MLLVKNEEGKYRCAKCGVVLKKDQIVKDRFLPQSCSKNISPDVNYVGVCKDCHKERLKLKVVLPSYWRFLSQHQQDNLQRQMRNMKSYVRLEVQDEELLKKVDAL
jgi:ribosomal protein L34E